MFKKLVNFVVAVAIGIASPFMAYAQTEPGPTLVTLTQSFTATDVIAAVMAIAVVLMAIRVAIKGARIVLSMIGGR